MLPPGATAQAGYSPRGLWDCQGAHFASVDTIAGLPLEVQHLLVKDGAVADRGQRFQDTDFVVVPNLPRRRLEMAAVSDGRVAAAIEQGGPTTDIWLFERGGAGWTGHAAMWAPSRGQDLAPESLDFLLYVVCRGYPLPDPPADRAVSGIVTGRGDLILTLKAAQATVAYELVANPAMRGASRYGEIRYLSTNKRLSPEERLDLRSKLEKVLDALSEGEPNRQMVATYVKVLQGNPARQR